MLIAAAAGATVIDAAAMPPVEAAAVIDTLPEATAVTRQVEPCTAAVATAVLDDVHDASVGGVVALPPVIWTARVVVSPMFNVALGGVIETTTGLSGAAATVTSSPQAPSAVNAPRLTATIAIFREKSCINPPLTRSWS